MFCGKCGNKNEGAKFCAKCGTPFDSNMANAGVNAPQPMPVGSAHRGDSKGRLLASGTGEDYSGWRVYYIVSMIVGLIFTISFTSYAIYVAVSPLRVLILFGRPIGVGITIIIVIFFIAGDIYSAYKVYATNKQLSTKVFVYENIIEGTGIVNGESSAQNFNLTYQQISGAASDKYGLTLNAQGSNFICYSKNAAHIRTVINERLRQT